MFDIIAFFVRFFEIVEKIPAMINSRIDSKDDKCYNATC